MMWRALAVFAAVLGIAWWAMSAMVQRHIEQVVFVHAHDKAGHLVDMLQSEASLATSLRVDSFSLASLGSFSSMAAATGVHAITLFDQDATQVLSIDSRSGVAEMYQDAASLTPNSHAGHDAHQDQTPLGGDNQAKPKRIHLDQAAHAGHLQHDHGAEQEAGLDIRPFDQTLILALHRATGADAFSFDKVETADGTSTWLVSIAEPVVGEGGAVIGYAGFTLDVFNLFTIFSDSIVKFSLTLLGVGLLLIGLPALGFFVQRRLSYRMQRNLAFLSRFDPLTKALNRGAFLTEARAQFAAGEIGHICYVDADRFKLINDTYGHAVGDAFLKHLAAVFRRNFPEPSLIARLGGDEFVIAVAKSDPDKVAARAGKMVLEASREVELDGITLSGSISVGLAKAGAGDDLDQVLQQADTALYFAKAGGRDTVAPYQDHMGDKMRRRRSLEARLRACLDEGEFEINYQPLVDAKSHALVSYEALLRMRDAEGQPVPPDEFIPLAEEMGLIEEIGTWVLHQATSDIAALEGGLKLSVNISPEQFRSGKLASHVTSALAASGMPAAHLELEITESLLIDDHSGTQFQLDTLREMGVSLAMDDFGTGFSSLSYLWKYGFDRLKIDRSFIRAMEENADRSMELIESIVLLGDRLGIQITAEGIETQDQAAILTNMGCDVLQGYFFGRPAPLAEDLAEQKAGA